MCITREDTCTCTHMYIHLRVHVHVHVYCMHTYVQSTVSKDSQLNPLHHVLHCRHMLLFELHCTLYVRTKIKATQLYAYKLCCVALSLCYAVLPCLSFQVSHMDDSVM